MSYRAEKQSTRKAPRGKLAEETGDTIDAWQRGYQAAIDELFMVGLEGGGRAAWASIQRRTSAGSAPMRDVVRAGELSIAFKSRRTVPSWAQGAACPEVSTTSTGAPEKDAENADETTRP